MYFVPITPARRNTITNCTRKFIQVRIDKVAIVTPSQPNKTHKKKKQNAMQLALSGSHDADVVM